MIASLPTWGFNGKVVAVTDGDTIRVLHDGTVTKVRLANIDAPEHNQAFGTKAKQFTSTYVFGKTVEVDEQGVDRYGRTIGEVIPPDNLLDLNHALVANGLAWIYGKYCHDASFYPLESNARSKHLGLWADPAPIPPWEFRHQEKLSRIGKLSCAIDCAVYTNQVKLISHEVGIDR
jgi:micrococcal nuclease